MMIELKCADEVEDGFEEAVLKQKIENIILFGTLKCNRPQARIEYKRFH